MRIKLDINAPVLSSQVLVHIIKLDRAQRRTTTPKIIHTRRESRSERFCTVPVRSFVRRFSQVSFLFSFDTRFNDCFLLVSKEKTEASRASVLHSVLHKSHIEY